MRSNAGQLAARWRRRRQAVPRELARSARRLAPLLSGTSRRLMGAHIYSVPIPKRGNKPLWTRTGELERSEGWKTTGPTITLQNTAPHALPRFQLGRPGHRKPVYTFSCQWQWEAIVLSRALILRERHAALLRALRVR